MDICRGSRRLEACCGRVLDFAGECQSSLSIMTLACYAIVDRRTVVAILQDLHLVGHYKPAMEAFDKALALVEHERDLIAPILVDQARIWVVTGHPSVALDCTDKVINGDYNVEDA